MKQEMLTVINDVQSCARVVGTLFTRTRNHDFETFRVIYRGFALEPLCPPIMTEYEILEGFLHKSYSASLGIDLSHPYWNKNLKYNPYQIFYTTIQFTEDHNEPLAETVLPPQDDVKKYINIVTNSTKRLHILKQWNYLLDISGGNVVGASNIGFVASRLMARAYDRNMYPSLIIGKDEMTKWNQSIAKFKKNPPSEINDGPGDTYYFWTHVFAVLTYNLIDDPSSKVFNKIYQYGSPIMVYVRGNIVHLPTLGNHKEASKIGRKIGLALVELIKNNKFNISKN